MKTLYLSILIGVFFQSCAVIGLSTDSDQNDLNNDPIAQAAARLRQDVQRSPAMIDQTLTPIVPRYHLTLGMSMSGVRSLWGDPQNVETAGDPGLGNQRWTYLNGLSSRYGISTTRVVYFEAGRVVGWETSH